jgi:hypothetical protein
MLRANSPGASWHWNTMIRKALFLGIGLVLAAAANAGVYTWTDEQGNVHYSDKPAAGAQTLDVQSAPTDPARIAAEQKAAEEQKAADMEAEKKSEEEAKLSQADDAKRKENCQKARVRLSAIMGAQRPYRPTADGERHYLSDEEIAAEIKDAEAGMLQWCSS